MCQVCCPSPSVLKLSNALPFYPPVNPGICTEARLTELRAVHLPFPGISMLFMHFDVHKNKTQGSD